MVFAPGRWLAGVATLARQAVNRAPSVISPRDSQRLQGAPAIDAAPLVSVDTMAIHDGQAGVRLDPHRGIPLPGCPAVIEVPSDAPCFYPDLGGGEWLICTP